MRQLLSLFFSVVLLSQQATLVVVVENVRNDKGVVGALLFNADKGWPEDMKSALAAQAVPARHGKVTLSFHDLAPGDYAIVVLHDENKNMELDRNFFGVPKEGWGMSNNPKPILKAPSFDRARFHFAGTGESLIRLRY